MGGARCRFRTPARLGDDLGHQLPVPVDPRVRRELPRQPATEPWAVPDAVRAGVRVDEADVDVIDVPNGRHAFETVDLTDESRDAVRRAMRAVLGRLGLR